MKADIDKVWSTWTTPADINEWNAASDDWHNPRSSNDLRPGGQFSYRMEARDGSFGFDFGGTYTNVILHECIEYVLGDDRKVTVRFDQSDSGVNVIETFEAEDEHTAEMQKQGWQSTLNRFAAYVESKK
ncbi:MAG: SRPBCC domain-containing protein [Isosphaeraceae bacterium]